MSCSRGWTDARVDALTGLWREGRTAAAIAHALGGVTRNAVLGKLHRLGLTGRNRKPSPPGGKIAASTPTRRRKTSRLRQPARAALAPPSAREVPDLVGLADVVSVGPHACRWPIGDPAAPAFSLCGRPAERGAYCAAHGAVAYRAVPRDHLLALAGLR